MIVGLDVMVVRVLFHWLPLYEAPTERGARALSFDVPRAAVCTDAVVWMCLAMKAASSLTQPTNAEPRVCCQYGPTKYSPGCR